MGLLDGLRILIIDDDADTLALNEMVLRRAGAQPIVAANVRQAVEAFRTKRPDVLLCDLNLGESADGCDLLKSLRDVTGQTIPAIALSGMPRDLAEPRALQSGFVAYVEKPTNPDALTRVIASATPAAPPTR